MTDQPYRRPDQRPDAQWSGAHPGGPQQPYAQQPFVQQGSPYGYPGYYGIPAEPKSLSIASMVCGIASVIMGWLLLPQFACPSPAWFSGICACWATVRCGCCLLSGWPFPLHIRAARSRANSRGGFPLTVLPSPADPAPAD